MLKFFSDVVISEAGKWNEAFLRKLTPNLIVRKTEKLKNILEEGMYTKQFLTFIKFCGP